MAERVQLQEPGTELTITISKVEVETIQNTEYYLFANGQKELLVPKSSVLSQLERLSAAHPIELVGKTVKFSRSTKLSKYGKPFWNLDLADAGTSASPAPVGGPSSSVGAPTGAESGKPKMRDAYKSLTQWVIDEIAPIYASEEWGMSATDIAAITATLFIQACKSGKVE